MSRQKQKGTAFETLIVRYLQQHLNPGIERRVLHGTQDRGDIAGVKDSHERKVVIECKNHTSPKLPEWLREAEQERINDEAYAGVVIHKRRGTTNPSAQYVTMTLETLIRLLQPAEEQKP